MPENNQGGRPPQEPPSGISQRQYNEIRDSLAALGKSELWKQVTAPFQSEAWQQIAETLKQAAAMPPETRQHLEALAQQLRRAELAKQEAKERAEQERRKAAEQEAAKQAWREQRKGVGGRSPVMTEADIEVARERLRQAIETEPKNRSLKFVYEGDFTVWWSEDPERKKREIPGRTTFRDNVFWPVCGKHHEKQRD